MSRKTTATYACALLKKHGYLYGVVERFIPQARKTIDYCGFADILAYHKKITGVLAVQTCAASGISAHVRKLTSPPVSSGVFWWLLAENRLEVWGWEVRETEYDFKPQLVRVSKDIALNREGELSVVSISEIPE